LAGYWMPSWVNATSGERGLPSRMNMAGKAVGYIGLGPEGLFSSGAGFMSSGAVVGGKGRFGEGGVDVCDARNVTALIC